MTKKSTPPLPPMPISSIENQIARVAATQALEGFHLTEEDRQLLLQHVRGEISEEQYVQHAINDVGGDVHDQRVDSLGPLVPISMTLGDEVIWAPGMTRAESQERTRRAVEKLRIARGGAKASGGGEGRD
jgi:hypothetical protein